MTINEIGIVSNDYTDENFSDNLIKNFADSGISRINVELNTILPPYDDAETYLAISDDWQRMVIIPFVCWSIKMNDSSLNEAERYRIQFEQGIRLLVRNKNKAISEEYRKEGFSNAYPIKPWFTSPSKSPRRQRDPIEYWYDEE